MSRLERLLRPKSICVVGGKEAAVVVTQSIRMGFAGEIWPVHPTKDEVAGIKAYRSVADLPGAPDATWIGVNRRRTIEVVKALAERGAGGAVCHASGFCETKLLEEEGARLQAELVAAAGEMPIIGPNCYGLINYADGALLWFAHGGVRLAQGRKGVAVLTQSSGLAINVTMQRRGLPISYVVTAGNQAQTGLSEMALSLIEDYRVTALGMYIEGFDSVVGFEKLAARARELKKPIIVQKAGRSEQSQQATISHTASLAGSDAATNAFLTRLGIARVYTLPSFIEGLKLLHLFGPLPGNLLSSMGWSGGEESLMADLAVGRRVKFPRLTQEHRERVQSTLLPHVAVANPLDFQTYAFDEASLTAIMTAMVSGGFDLNISLVDFPRSDRCDDEGYWTLVRSFESALKTNDARGAVVSLLPEGMPEHYANRLMARGILSVAGIAELLDAAEAAAFIGAAWRTPQAQPLANTGARTSEAKRVMLDEARAKELLAEAGLPVPMGERVGNAGSAAASAKALGFPVALKALGVAHKADVGAVRLNLKDAESVLSAANDLLPLGTGLYVERMVSGAVAELIVGFTIDPVLGHAMTLGTGGVIVELLRDSATLLLPATHHEIEAALHALKLFPLLDGYRGRPRADIEAAIAAIAGIAEFVHKRAGEINELDINPLIVCAKGEGAWIADVLLVLASN